MIAVYMRVSTDKQDTSSQKHEIDKFLIAHNMSNVAWYVDEGISGKTSKRPSFQRMCLDVETGRVSDVIVYRLDRLGRDAMSMMKLLLLWLQKSVNFYSVSQPVLQLGPTNPFRLTMLSIFAELAQAEREITVQRIKAGLAATKARGTKLGAKEKYAAMVPVIKAMRAAGKTVKEIVRELRIPRSTVYRLLLETE